VPFERLGAADRKAGARAYLLSHYRKHLQNACLFLSNSSLVTGGRCVTHGKTCLGTTKRMGHRVSTLSGGLPCQAYTKQRQKTGETARTGRANQHPDHESVLDSPDLLEEIQPAQFWIEEVQDFRAHLKDFMRKCARAGPGYSCKAVVCDHADFCMMDRGGLSCHKQVGESIRYCLFPLAQTLSAPHWLLLAIHIGSIAG